MSDRIRQIFAFSVFLSLLLFCGCGAVQVAESEKTTEETELHWKTAKGEKLYYEYYEQISETGEIPKKEIAISWSDDKAAVSIEEESVIMDREGRFYNAQNLSLPPEEQIQFTLASLFPLPSGKIKRGESWTVEVKSDDGKRFSGSVTATLAGFEDWQGKNCAVIAISAKSTAALDSPGFTFTALKTLSGTHLFDIGSGRFVKGELQGEIVSTSRLKPEKAEEIAPPEGKTTQKVVVGYVLLEK